MKYSLWKVLWKAIWGVFLFFCLMSAMVRPGWEESDRLILIVLCAISVKVMLEAPPVPSPAGNLTEAVPSQTASQSASRSRPPGEG